MTRVFKMLVFSILLALTSGIWPLSGLASECGQAKWLTEAYAQQSRTLHVTVTHQEAIDDGAEEESASSGAEGEQATMANGIPSLDLGRVTGYPGETVRIPVTLSNASGYEIAAVSIDISYDIAVLENASAEIGPAGSAAGKYVVFNEISSGILRVGVSGVNQNLIGDGVVAYVVFDIKADAVMGKTDLGNAPSASDPSGNDVPIEGESGAVTAMTILYVSHNGVCNDNEPCYTLIQDAIDAADDVSLIKVTEGTYDQDLVIDEPKNLTIQGGWDSTFTTRFSDTTIRSMRISNGTVKTEYLVIR